MTHSAEKDVPVISCPRWDVHDGHGWRDLEGDFPMPLWCPGMTSILPSGTGDNA